jgi:hypothetical protein
MLGDEAREEIQELFIKETEKRQKKLEEDALKKWEEDKKADEDKNAEEVKKNPPVKGKAPPPAKKGKDADKPDLDVPKLEVPQITEYTS